MGLQIDSQHNTGTTMVAYRPISYTVRDTTGTPGTDNQIVYCDVYIDGVYYKSIFATSPTIPGTIRYWFFDIQQPLQEYLYSRPVEDPTFATAAVTANNNGKSYAQVFVKFRGSTLTGGAITPQTPAPVQGTMTTAPSSGTGLQSNTIVVVNSTLQHEDTMSFRDHLITWKPQSYVAEIWTASHRPKNGYQISSQDYDHLPIYCNWFAFGGNFSGFTVDWGLEWTDGTGLHSSDITTTLLLACPSLSYVPSGIPQLTALSYVTITPDWATLQSYRIYIKYSLPGPTPQLFKSPLFVVNNCRKRKRLRFMNWLGMFESVNFSYYQEEMPVTSDERRRPMNQFIDGNAGIARQGHSLLRSNVRSNEILTLQTIDYPDSAQQWLKELFSSPTTYLETDGLYNNAALDPLDRIPLGRMLLNPVNVLDGSFVMRKLADRYEYVTEIKIKMSNENFHIIT